MSVNRSSAYLVRERGDSDSVSRSVPRLHPSPPRTPDSRALRASTPSSFAAPTFHLDDDPEPVVADAATAGTTSSTVVRPQRSTSDAPASTRPLSIVIAVTPTTTPLPTPVRPALPPAVAESPLPRPMAAPAPAHPFHRSLTVSTLSSASSAPALIRPLSSMPSPGPSATPPPMLRTTSCSPGPIHAALPALPWVCHANRELLRIAFSKRAHVHRGILEPRFQGALDHASASAASSAVAAAKKQPASSSTPSPLLLQQQLANASAAAAAAHVSFHIAVSGSAAAGKTSTLHNLTGRSVPLKHMETSGMQLLDLAWPYKHAGATGDVQVCDLLFWDSGATSSQQYKYIQTTPESHASCCIYVVSCLDQASWTHTQKRLQEDAEKPFAKIIVCTKIDERLKREVQEAAILSFADQYNKRHFPPTSGASSSSSSSSASSTPPPAYTRGSVVVAKIANWPITNEPFYTRPGVASLVNTIAAMCIATKST